MTNLKKLIPAVALFAALSPFAANAFSGTAHKTVHISSTAIATHVATNSKGRPGEFSTARVAVNSKGRPGEFSTARMVAANSKSRPGEFDHGIPQSVFG